MAKSIGEALAGAFAMITERRGGIRICDRAAVARADEMLSLPPEMRSLAIREIDEAIHLCESQIEQVALHQLAGFNFGNEEWPSRARILTRRGEIDHYPDMIHVIPQVKFGRYRVDILVDAGGSKLFAIECDGKEFHQNPEKDRARDSDLSRDSRVKVFRVSGSAIYSGPYAVHGICSVIKGIVFP